MKNEELKKQDKYRKKHIAFHHSTNRFCLKCIDIGRKEAQEEFMKKVDKLKKVFKKKIELENDGAGNYQQRIGMIYWDLDDAIREVFGDSSSEVNPAKEGTGGKSGLVKKHVERVQPHATSGVSSEVEE